jgi:hypothetical protein
VVGGLQFHNAVARILAAPRKTSGPHSNEMPYGPLVLLFQQGI